MAKPIQTPTTTLKLRYFADRKAACYYLNGRRRLIGPWPEFPNPPCQEIQAAFNRLAHRHAQGLPLDGMVVGETVSVAVLVQRVIKWAEGYYTASNEAANLAAAAKDLLALFADKEVDSFRPSELVELQGYMVRKGHTRQGVNRRINQIRRIFRKGVEMGVCHPSVLVGLQAVRGLSIGRGAPESTPRGAVADSLVQATLPFVPRVVAALIQFQRLTGCRPGEACRFNLSETERVSDNLWVYRPAKHKTAHRGKPREIYLGPRAIEVVKPYLRADGKPLFSPADCVEELRLEKRARRKTKVQPSQVDRCKKDPKTYPGDSYPVSSYRRAIARAADKASVPQWSPNQLRKARGQELRDLLGAEVSAAALGHALDVNQRFYTTGSQQAAKAAIETG